MKTKPLTNYLAIFSFSLRRQYSVYFDVVSYNSMPSLLSQRCVGSRSSGENERFHYIIAGDLNKKTKK